MLSKRRKWYGCRNFGMFMTWGAQLTKYISTDTVTLLLHLVLINKY